MYNIRTFGCVFYVMVGDIYSFEKMYLFEIILTWINPVGDLRQRGLNIKVIKQKRGCPFWASSPNLKVIKLILHYNGLLADSITSNPDKVNASRLHANVKHACGFVDGRPVDQHSLAVENFNLPGACNRCEI